jgi:hypothetical protein
MGLEMATPTTGNRRAGAEETVVEALATTIVGCWIGLEGRGLVLLATTKEGDRGHGWVKGKVLGSSWSMRMVCQRLDVPRVVVQGMERDDTGAGPRLGWGRDQNASLRDVNPGLESRL